MQTPDQSISHFVSRISYDSQDPQWKKLQIKYKQCIRLLKKKIVQLEARENTVTKASLSVTSVIGGVGEWVEKMEERVWKVVERRVRWGWEGIKIGLEREVKVVQEKQQGKEVETLKQKREQYENKEDKINTNNKKNCLFSGLKILSNLISQKKQQSLQLIQTHDNHFQQLDRISSIVNSKLISFKSIAFISIKLHNSTTTQKVSQLKYVQSLLSSLSLNTSTLTQPSLSSISPPSLYLSLKQNSLLHHSLTTLQSSHSLTTSSLHSSHSSLSIQLLKKQSTISQLLQQLSHKQKIISQYQSQLQTYRNMKGKGKCSYDCMVEKKKLGMYYQGALQDVRGKKGMIEELERQVKGLRGEVEGERRVRERVDRKMEVIKEERERQRVEKQYRQKIEQQRDRWINERMRIVDQKQNKLSEIQHYLWRIQSLLYKVFQISTSPPSNQQTEQSLLSSIISLLTQQFTSNPLPSSSEPKPSMIPPGQILLLIQKLLSQSSIQLTDYPILPKSQQQRFQLIQNTILSLKQLSFSPPVPNIPHNSPSHQDDILIIKPLKSNNDTNLLIKVIDLQSQVKKSEQMILNLKKNFLTAREMVLKCLDEMEVGKEGRLEELFELFQYTDDERQIVMIGRKGEGKERKGRLFGRWF